MVKKDHLKYLTWLFFCLSTVALLYPVIFFYVDGDALQYGPESVAYRYFFAYRLHEGEIGSYFCIQGFLTTVIQRIIFSILHLFINPVENLRLSIKWFSILTMFVQAGLCSLALIFFIYKDLALRLLQKILLTSVMLIPIYSTIVGFHYFLKPDYYQLDVVLYAAFAFVALKMLSAPEEFISTRRQILLGLFSGLLISNKITFVFPCMALFSPALVLCYKEYKVLFLKAATFFLATLSAFVVVVVLAYLPQVDILVKTLPLWLEFIRSPGAEFNTFSSFINHLENNNYVWSSVIFLIFLISYIINFFRSNGYQDKRYCISILFLILSSVSILTIMHRAAGTTIFEAFLCLTAISLVVVALTTSVKIKSMRSIYYLVALMLPWQMSKFPIEYLVKEVKASGGYSSDAWDLHAMVSKYDKPVFAIIPDNNLELNIIYGPIEMALLKGLSDVPSWNITTGQDLLTRLAPNLHFRSKQMSIEHDINNSYPDGAVLMWFGPVQSAKILAYPVVKGIVARKTTKCREVKANDGNHMCTICES